MKLEDIFAEWDKDSLIDRTELGTAALNISKLHNKYYNIYMAEKLKLIQMKSELKQISSHRYDFYNGTIDDETLTEYGWLEEFRDVSRKKFLKSDINRYVESDRIVIERNLKIATQQEKVDFIDSIIKSLVGRGFNIRAGIDFMKFQSGA